MNEEKWKSFSSKNGKRKVAAGEKVGSVNRKKIVIFNPAAYIGGAERGLLEIIESLKENYKIVVVHPDSSSELGEFLFSYSKPFPFRNFIAFSRTEKNSWFNFFRALKEMVDFFFFLKKEAPDLLISNGIKAHFLFAFFKVILNKPLVVIWRDELKWNSFWRVYFSFLSLMADRIIITSKHLADYFSSHQKVTILPNPSLQDRTRRSFFPAKKNRKSLVLGFVANFAPLKGLEDLLIVLPYLAKEKKVKVKIAGRDIYNTTPYYSFYSWGINFLIEKLKSEGYDIEVKWYKMKEIEKFYQEIDFLLVCSRREGFGRIVKEAIEREIPFISSRVGYWKQFENIWGEDYFYTPGNLEELRKKIKKALSKEPDWFKLKKYLFPFEEYKKEFLGIVKDFFS